MLHVTFADPRLPEVTITWAEGTTFNIYHKGWNVDMLPVYGDEAGNAPDANKAREVVCELFNVLVSGDWELFDGRGRPLALLKRPDYDMFIDFEDED